MQMSLILFYFVAKLNIHQNDLINFTRRQTNILVTRLSQTCIYHRFCTSFSPRRNLKNVNITDTTHPLRSSLFAPFHSKQTNKPVLCFLYTESKSTTIEVLFLISRLSFHFQFSPIPLSRFSRLYLHFHFLGFLNSIYIAIILIQLCQVSNTRNRIAQLFRKLFYFILTFYEYIRY
jgi:hypothetical protein